MKRRTLAALVVVAVAAAAFVGLRGFQSPQSPAREPGVQGPARSSGMQAPARSPDAPALGRSPDAPLPGRSSDATAPARSSDAGSPATVEFAASDLYTVVEGRIGRSIPVTGTLAPVQRTTVRSKVAGEVAAITVREGDTVRQGQPIARLDPTDFELRLRERDAQLRSAQAQLAQAQRTLENNQRLLEKQFISQNAFDNSRSAVDIAAAARDAASAQLAQAGKALADTRIAAPIDGVVAERFVQAGEKVSPDSRIVSIVDLSRMEIEAPVPAADVASVRVGQAVTLAVEGVEGTHVGKVARINPGTLAGTRSVAVYIAVDFPRNAAPARAGMFAQGRLALEARPGTLVVPTAAIRDSGGRQFVYLIEDGRLAERNVRVGLRDDSARTPQGGVGLVEVLEGLKAGDHVVGVNLGALRAGSRVAVAPAAPAATKPPATRETREAAASSGS